MSNHTEWQVQPQTSMNTGVSVPLPGRVSKKPSIARTTTGMLSGVAFTEHLHKEIARYAAIRAEPTGHTHLIQPVSNTWTAMDDRCFSRVSWSDFSVISFRNLT